MAFTKGDIIWVNADKRHPDTLRHPAIVWDEEIGDDADFHGIMLTHSEPNGRYDNIIMTANHFEAGHEIVFNNTHFVNQLFIKFQGWGPFYKGGALTSAGIEFIESTLSNVDSMSYDEYVANNRR